MPTKLNVGASRKVTDDNYGSHGASVNLEIELDSSLSTDPAKLQDRIRQLFTMVHKSLNEELQARRRSQSPRASEPDHLPAASAPASNGRKPGGSARLATSKQVKALYAIAKERGFDLRELLRDRYQVERPEEFTLQQASDLIGELRSASSLS